MGAAPWGNMPGPSDYTAWVTSRPQAPATGPDHGFRLDYCGFTLQQQPGSYQGGHKRLGPERALLKLQNSPRGDCYVIYVYFSFIQDGRPFRTMYRK